MWPITIELFVVLMFVLAVGRLSVRGTRLRRKREMASSFQRVAEGRQSAIDDSAPDVRKQTAMRQAEIGTVSSNAASAKEKMATTGA